MRKLTALLGFALVAGLASTADAGFTNPGFETGDFTGWDVYLTHNGATAVQDVVMFDLGYGESYVGRFSVGNAEYTGLQEGVVVSQTMWLVGGFAYDLGCHAGAYRPTGGGNAEGGVFTLFVDGSNVDSFAVGSIYGGDPPVLFSLDGSYTPAADGYYEVGVTITRPYTIPGDLIYQMVDDFYITPAPGALALLGLAGLMRRRRR